MLSTLRLTRSSWSKRGIRRQLALAGSRLAQVAGSGDVEAALNQASQAHRDLDACRARWLVLPERLRREAPREHSRGERGHDAAHHAAAVRQEIRRLREDAHAGRAAGMGERVALVAGDVAQALAAGATLRERQVSEAAVVRPGGEVAQAAGAGALRDLAAGPSQIAWVREWLRPAPVPVVHQRACAQRAFHRCVAGCLRRWDGLACSARPPRSVRQE